MLRPAAARVCARAARPAPWCLLSAGPAPPGDPLYGYFPGALPGGPPPGGPFAVDAGALRREFLRLQAAAHPDKHPSGARADAAAASAAINHAYRTLADPLLRAQYLLARRGVDVAADESTLRADGADADLLAAVMAAHETVEDAAAPDDLLPLRRANDARLRAAEDCLARAFAADNVPAAAREAVRLRYWVNIRAALDAWDDGRPVALPH